jgi:arginyl-tRNA synthetase
MKIFGSVAGLLFLIFFFPFIEPSFARQEKVPPPASCLDVLPANEAAPIPASKTEDVFRRQVLESLLRALPPEAALDATQINEMLANPPNFDMGQLAFPCFTLAKKLRKAPVQIAEYLKGQISSQLPSFVESVQVAGPYVNFSMNTKLFSNWLFEKVRDRSYFASATPFDGKAEKINLEFSQPNTHKALHVGHLRNMVYGEGVASLLEFAGHKVVRTTYPGDLGAHVAKVLWYIQSQKNGAVPNENNVRWLGEMYAEADQFVRAQEGTPSADETKNAIERTLQNIQNRQGPDYEFYLTTRQWSLDEMNRVYDWLGIHFNQWYFESECDEPSRQLVDNYLERGLFAKSQGAVGIDLAAFNLPFAMLLTSGGNGLYLTKDLELIRRKFSDPEITRSLVVVDDRQKLHFQQVFKIAELMGYPQAKQSAHLAYATVNTADGTPFSSRTLNGLGIDEIRQNVENRLAPNIRKTFAGRYSEAEINGIMHDYALGAIKYGFLRVDPIYSIRFDLNEWLRFDGDTAIALFNLYAKSRKLIAEAGKVAEGTVLEPISTSEKQLLEQLRRFPEFAMLASHRFKPSFLTGYLYELSHVYSGFLAENQVSPTRLALIEMTSEVLKKALSTLGIAVPGVL